MGVKRQRTLTSFQATKKNKNGEFAEYVSEVEHRHDGAPKSIALPGATVFYARNVFSFAESQTIYDELEGLEGWAQQSITIFGRNRQENRKTSVFTLPSLYPQPDEIAKTKLISYRYSGRDNIGVLAPQCLINIHRRVEEWVSQHDELSSMFSTNGQLFNYVLGNFYSNGSQNIGMHSDDEKGLSGPILSVSFGTSRFFDFHEKSSSSGNPHKLRLTLEPGSILVMAGDTQRNYKHGVPIQKKIENGRINLTFRHVKQQN